MVFRVKFLLLYCSMCAVAADFEYSLTATAGQLLTISERYLPSFGESGPQYHVTKPLATEDGHLLLLYAPGQEVYEFTQDDVRRMDLIYVPPPPHLVSEERTTNFLFTKSRGSQEHSFTIHLLPLGHREPKFNIINPVITVPIQTDVVNISRKYLEVDGFTDTNVVYMAIEGPSHGKVTLLGADGAVTLDENEVTKDQLMSATLQYKRDNVGEFVDSVEILATDLQAEATTVITFNFTNSRREEIVPLQVAEGMTVVLASDYFSYALNGGGGRSNVMYQMLDSPQYGAFALLGRPLMRGGTFSQDDANKARLTYRATAEIGHDSVNERIPLTISDSSGSRYRPQVLSITIRPRDNQAPVVLVNGEVIVQEGQSEILFEELITVMDPDSRDESLYLELDVPPSFGHLSIETGGPIARFSVGDLRAGVVRYVQSFHRGVEPSNDVLLFHASDGSNNRSPTLRLNVSIELVNDEPPVLMTSDLDVHHEAIIKNSSLYAADFDTPASKLVLTLLQEPTLGVIRRRATTEIAASDSLVAGSKFSYSDIVNELILYTAHELSAGQDSAVFSITDGDFTAQAALIFKLITQKDQVTETVTHLFMNVGGFVNLTEEFGYMHNRKITLTNTSNLLELQVKSSQGWNAVSSFIPKKDNVRLLHTGVSKAIIPLMFRVEESKTQLDNLLVLVIEVRDNMAPPVLNTNSELIVYNNMSALLTTRHLSAYDLDTTSSRLVYTITTRPKWGRLLLHGQSTSSWTQDDLENERVIYFHDGGKKTVVDSFQFSISDGTNLVSDLTFEIQIRRIAILVTEVLPLQVSVGSRASVTQFQLQVAFSRPELLIFAVLIPPKHGHLRFNNHTATMFSMMDLVEGHLEYQHDVRARHDDYDEIVLSLSCQGRGCDSHDVPHFSNMSLILPIHIHVAEKDAPMILVNSGIKYLEMKNAKAVGYLSKSSLLAKSEDARKIVYVVTQPPEYGLLYKNSIPVSVFTQEDVDAGKIYYELDSELPSRPGDHFVFDVSSSSKTSHNNTLYIQWSWISIDQMEYTVRETDGILRIKLRRDAATSLPYISTVRCHATPPGNATLNDDFELKYELIQFDLFETEKSCIIKINNDNKFEGLEYFTIEIAESEKSIIGTDTTRITILDVEDYPKLNFKAHLQYVQETDGPLNIEIFRTGDLNTSTSVKCWTEETGRAKGGVHHNFNHADYVARFRNDNSSLVVFRPGESSAKCVVNIIDDSIYEETEDFFVVISDPIGGELGTTTRLRLLIEGPNDVSLIHFSQNEVNVLENAGELDVSVTRSGTDLTHESRVWCTTQSISAQPKMDYIPSSQQVVFGRGDTEAWCRISILDDADMSILEGPLQLGLILNSAEAAELVEPTLTTIVIDDTFNDTPTLEFVQALMSTQENAGIVDVPLIRKGDTRSAASVKCYTRQRTARADVDFVDRTKTESSRVYFDPGQTLASCNVSIIDDTMLEGEEDLVLRLSEPMYQQNQHDHQLALLGDNVMMRLKIVDPEDAPRIMFEQRQVIVNESIDDPITFSVGVVRSGDTSAAASVHVMSRDGTAISGTHYVPVSQHLRFAPGDNMKHVLLTILPGEHDERREHNFFLLLESEELRVNILRPSASAIVLPSQPVVLSLKNYGQIDQETQPESRYPLVCVEPCNVYHPQYENTKNLCNAIKMASLKYSWEVSAPSGLRHTPFHKLTTSTFFARVDTQVLDTIFYSENFKIRCSVQPVKRNGRLGVSVTSDPIIVLKSADQCKGDRAFTAQVLYINETSQTHPNSVHIKVDVPHEDGMVPLVSTQPLQNVRALLTDPLYSAHHMCSNLLQGRAFLEVLPTHQQITSELVQRDKETVQMYRHLDLQSCRWRFDAWFHMSQLVDDCRGKVESEFKLSESSPSGQVNVEVPLHVSYVKARGVEEWSAVEHRTTLVVSVRYSALLWHSGVLTGAKVGSANLQISRVFANEAGQLVIEFWTEALFRGRFVLWNPSAPRLQSSVISAAISKLSFRLEIVWSEPTWNGPRQLWRATTNASLADYSGQYIAQLVPCSVALDTTVFVDTEPPKCQAHAPSRFPFQVTFQVPLRPEPAKFALQTKFDITNNPHQFMSDSQVGDTTLKFNKGESVLGRVSWSSNRDLSHAYRLQIDRVLLCARRDVDVNLGCLHSSLPHRFILLDRERPDTQDNDVRGVQFLARFARDVPGYRDALKLRPGVDGFIWQIDPLYQIESTHSWLLQVLYRIRASSETERRSRRSDEDAWQKGSAMRVFLLADSPASIWGLPTMTLALMPLALAVMSVVTWRILRYYSSVNLIQ